MKKILMVLAVGAAGLASAAESCKEHDTGLSPHLPVQGHDHGEGCAHDHAESAHGASVAVSASAARGGAGRALERGVSVGRMRVAQGAFACARHGW